MSLQRAAQRARARDGSAPPNLVSAMDGLTQAQATRFIAKLPSADREILGAAWISMGNAAATEWSGGHGLWFEDPAERELLRGLVASMATHAIDGLVAWIRRRARGKTDPFPERIRACAAASTALRMAAMRGRVAILDAAALPPADRHPDEGPCAAVARMADGGMLVAAVLPSRTPCAFCGRPERIGWLDYYDVEVRVEAPLVAVLLSSPDADGRRAVTDTVAAGDLLGLGIHMATHAAVLAAAPKPPPATACPN